MRSQDQFEFSWEQFLEANGLPRKGEAKDTARLFFRAGQIEEGKRTIEMRRELKELIEVMSSIGSA